MKKLFFLYFFSVLLCLSAHSSNAVEEITVTTFQDLKTALENSKGSNVKLGASIKVPSNYGSEIAIEIRSGEHFLNLNGFNIEYYYTNNAREYDGVPIFADSNLTINGEGTITGGYVALQASNHGLITLNGGNYVAKAASGIRVQGPIIINKGTFSGRFGQIWLEGGMVVDNANAIHDIDYTFNRGGVVIKNGVATGKTQLERVQVSLSNITMA
ncbi:MAG: hypothetical protein JW708_05590, partial [Vallitaleaceae bacterium]|nr:hypothetical protein [Vallitaleaceae bacterium]